MKKRIFLIGLLLVSVMPIQACAETVVNSGQMASSSESTESSQISSESDRETSETTTTTETSAEAASSSTEDTVEESQPVITPRLAQTETAASTFAVPSGYHLYNITSYATFKAAMQDTAYTKKYLLLQTDIVYGYVNGGIDTLTFTGDTIIDGAGTDGTHQYGMYYGYTLADGTNNWATLLKVSTANLNITFRNLKFGSSAYPNSTTAGLVYPYTDGSSFAANLNLTVENINYNIPGNGGVPFNGYYGTGSTVTFKGTNSFISSSTGNYGREFASGFRNVVFDSNSTNHIKVMSNPSGEDAVFRGESERGPIDVALNPRAQVTIDNGKNDLFASTTANLTIGEEAQFHYNVINGGGLRNVSYLNSGIRGVSDGAPTTISVGKNAEAVFENNKSISTSWAMTGNTVINANQPKRVLFSKIDTSGSLFTGGSLTFNRKDTDATKKDQISLLTNEATETTNSKLLGLNQSAVYNQTATGNQVALVYQPTATISNLSTTTQVAPRQSDLILGETVTVASTDRTLQQVSYKVATTNLIPNQDINSDSTQATIENTADGALLANQVVTGSTQLTLNQLVAQDYYLYAKVKDQVSLTASNRSFTVSTTSNWFAATQTVEPGIFVQLPVATEFASPMTGAFQSSSYAAENLGNTPVAISVSALSAGATNQFTLVDQLSKPAKFEATLDLSLKAAFNNQQKVVSLTTIDSSQAIVLPPFSGANSSGTFAFQGNYSGPLSGIKQSNYQLTFSIQPIGD